MVRRFLRHTNEETSKKWYLQADIANMRRTVEGFDY